MLKNNIALIINYFIIILIILLLSFFIGTRDLNVGTDTLAYNNFFIYTNSNIETRISEPFFLLLAKTSYLFSDDFKLFAIIVTFISCLFYFLFYYLILKKDIISTNQKYYIIYVSFIIMIISPFFWNSQLNVMRIGIAIPILFLGSYFLYLNKPVKALLFFISSILFHFSMILFLPFIFMVYLKEKKLVVIFVLLSILYISKLGEILFNILSNNLVSLEALQYYLNNATNERGYKNGVRLDFYIFTLFFFLLSYVNRKYSKSSNYLFKLYTVLSFPFLIIGFINFSDRIIMISWSLIPFIIALFTIRIIKGNNLTYVFSISFLILISLLMLWYKNLF